MIIKRSTWVNRAELKSRVELELRQETRESTQSLHCANSEATEEPQARKKAKYDVCDLVDLQPKVRVTELKKFCNLQLSEVETESLNDGHILPWWKEHEKDFPVLSLLAKTYLCIPAISASSERVFSTAGRVVEERRSSLLSENLDSLLLIHDNN